MAKTASKLTVPGVLAFERKLSPSDGRMYSNLWDERESGKHEPLSIIEKSVRGTISNRLKKGKSTDTTKIDAEMQKPNLQSVDVCSLPEHHDTLVLRFTLKILSGIGDATACNDADFQSSLREQVASYFEATGAEQLGLRYATNLANARFLWRNRVGAENVAVIVKTLAGLDSETTFRFDSLDLGLTAFDHNNADIKTLGKMISATLRGETDFLLLSVNAFAQLGGGQEVFPSQEIMQNAPSGKGEKSKYLYSVDGIAGMHYSENRQRIANDRYVVRRRSRTSDCRRILRISDHRGHCVP